MVFFWRKKKKEQEADKQEQQEEQGQQVPERESDESVQLTNDGDQVEAAAQTEQSEESIDVLEPAKPVELNEDAPESASAVVEKNDEIAALETKEPEDAISPDVTDEAAEKPVAEEPELKQEPKDSVEDVETPTLEAQSVQPENEETQPQADAEVESEKKGWFARLSDGLSKSTNKVTQGLADFVTKRKLDQDALDDLEDALIMADLGPKTAASIVAEFAKTRFEKDVDSEEIRTALAQQVEEILTPVAMPLVPQIKAGEPFVILVTGVNGVGKTTTIGKMARQFQMQGHSVMLAAADTFRAAAVEQLSVWAERNSVPIVKKDVGADPAAVAYEAYDKAKAEGADILMIDTAGRLHNKKNLMDELQKLVRVIRKHDETAPHSTLLVLDATTGQNAHSQVDAFKELVNISGLIVTKLDGSAKGGVLVSLADQYGLPVHAIGVGETIEDLQPFTANEFARSLMGVVQ